MEQIQISAKNLGALTLDDFCERCFYIKLKSKRLPWQMFPGIFSSIDAYTKKIMHNWIDNPARQPKFISDMGITSYGKVLHWSKSKLNIPEFGITLTGIPDDLWIGPEGIHIPDAKTAKYSATQDKLIPMYKVQLNGYAKIYKALGENVTRLSMIYMEPVTDEMAAVGGAHPEFFKMQFNPKFVPVEVDTESLDSLFAKTREIFDGPIPELSKGCKDCEALENIWRLVSR